MEATLYVNTTTKAIRASTTGSALPDVAPRLQTHLKLTVYFFETGEDPALLNGSTTFRVVLKDKNTPSGSVLALLSAATDTGADYYEFEWASVDSATLRTLLGDSESVEAILEVEWTLATTIERAAMEVTIQNAWARTTDGPPDPTEDASWEWLKEKIQAGDNLTRTLNETTKVMTLSVPDFADGREVELQAGVTHLQWRYVGEASWTDLIALTSITGPAGADGADSTVPGPQGEDGSEIELQAGVTHLQWRYVGAMSWTDLIALTAITGPAGADGADALPVASQAEAEAGTSNEKSMTPLRTAEAIAALAGASGGADVRVYTADATWTNPSPSIPRPVYVKLISGGGGGGGGAKGADGVVRRGGSSGQAGGIRSFWCLSTELSATEDVVVGAGGAGGSGASTNSSAGANGTAGGTTSFGAAVAAAGGGGIGGGLAAGGTAVAAQTNASVELTNNVSISASAAASTTGAGGGGGPNSNGYFPSPGGAGGGLGTGNGRSNGGAGGSVASIIGGNGGGAAGGVAFPGTGIGADGASSKGAGGGGGGGASGNVGLAGGAGGAGGFPGGGGGGGGAGKDDDVGAYAGGPGGAGVVMIIVY